MTSEITAPSEVEVIVAGHRGDSDIAQKGLGSSDSRVRVAALFALDRLGVLSAAQVESCLRDTEMDVRLAAAELSAKYFADLTIALNDSEYLVVEMGAWACGEHESVSEDVFARLLNLGVEHTHPLVREASIAALGALGDDRALPVILAGCNDKPAIRRRAVLALAPFDGVEVEAAIDKALNDKDWQVRQSAEDLRR
jgi:HEAT repeat protein